MAIDNVLRNLSANLASKGIKEYLEKKMNRSFEDLLKNGISEEEFKELSYYMEMLTSIWSHAVYADNEYQEEEEDMVFYFFKYLFMDVDPENPERNPILPASVLSDSGYDVVELMALLLNRFKEPFKIDKVINYAIEHDLQKVFYVQALCIVTADSVLESHEKQFIDELAVELEFDENEKKALEQEYYKMIK